jgi:hypothetical protein
MPAFSTLALAAMRRFAIFSIFFMVFITSQVGNFFPACRHHGISNPIPDAWHNLEVYRAATNAGNALAPGKKNVLVSTNDHNA